MMGGRFGATSSCLGLHGSLPLDRAVHKSGLEWGLCLFVGKAD